MHATLLDRTSQILRHYRRPKAKNTHMPHNSHNYHRTAVSVSPSKGIKRVPFNSRVYLHPKVHKELLQGHHQRPSHQLGSPALKRQKARLSKHRPKSERPTHRRIVLQRDARAGIKAHGMVGLRGSRAQGLWGCFGLCRHIWL